MSMVFAGFMDAAREERQRREDREQQEKLLAKKHENAKELKTLGLFAKQRLKDKALGKQVDLLMDQHGIPAGQRSTVARYVEGYGAEYVNENIDRLWDGSGNAVSIPSVSGNPNYKGSSSLTGKMGHYADGIAAVESRGMGGYSAKGKIIDNPDSMYHGDRAYGRYQVMGKNIPEWSKRHLGRELTPEEFLADPEAQDKIFEGEFGSYVQRYGNPNDAAAAWFSGGTLEENWDRNDGNIDTRTYVGRFATALNDLGGGASDDTRQALDDGNVQVASAEAGAAMPDGLGGVPLEGATGEGQSDGVISARQSTPSETASTPSDMAVASPQTGTQTSSGQFGGWRPEEQDLDDLIGKDPAFYDQWLAANGDKLGTRDITRVRQMQKSAQEAARAKNTDPEIYTDREALSGMPYEQLRSLAASYEAEDNQEALEALAPHLSVKEEYENMDSKPDWANLETVREGNWKSLEAAALEAGDKEQAGKIRSLGQRISNSSTEVGDTIFLVNSRDEAGDKVPQRAYRRSDGSYITLSQNKVIPAEEVSGRVTSLEEASDRGAALARFSGDKIDPLRESRSNMHEAARAAMDIDELVKQNDAVLTQSGGALSGLFEKLRQEAGTIKEMFNDGATEEEILGHLNTEAERLIGRNDTLSQNASDYVQFTSQITEFAFKYAAAGLGQQGRGLSDSDFRHAMRVVNNGSSYGSFSRNLRNLMDGALTTMDEKISSTRQDPQVRDFYKVYGEDAEEVLGPTFRPMYEYLDDTGVTGVKEWAKGSPEQAATSTGGTAQTDAADVEAAMNSYMDTGSVAADAAAYHAINPDEQDILLGQFSNALGIPESTLREIYERQQ